MVPGLHFERGFGWRAYRKYLKENAASPDGHAYRVTGEFTVESSGAITGLHPKDSNESLKQKARELIDRGPAWQRRRDGEFKKVILRLTFDKHHDN